MAGQLFWGAGRKQEYAAMAEHRCSGCSDATSPLSLSQLTGCEVAVETAPLFGGEGGVARLTMLEDSSGSLAFRSGYIIR